MDGPYRPCADGQGHGRLLGEPYPEHLLEVLLKPADRFGNVQRLDTHPRPVKRRSSSRETCRHLLPLATGVPWFETASAQWRQAHRHLEA